MQAAASVVAAVVVIAFAPTVVAHGLVFEEAAIVIVALCLFH
jgi:hypothetical protein